MRGPWWSFLVEQAIVTDIKEGLPLKHRWQRGNVVQGNSDEAAQSRVERLESGDFARGKSEGPGGGTSGTCCSGTRPLGAPADRVEVLGVRQVYVNANTWTRWIAICKVR